MELNPNHPVTRATSEQWHTICALLLRKFGKDHVVITMNDLVDIRPDSMAITVQELEDGLHLRLVSMEDGKRLARKEGGLPI